jgi:hypothetical protein
MRARRAENCSGIRRLAEKRAAPFVITWPHFPSGARTSASARFLATENGFRSSLAPVAAGIRSITEYRAVMSGRPPAGIRRSAGVEVPANGRREADCRSGARVMGRCHVLPVQGISNMLVLPTATQPHRPRIGKDGIAVVNTVRRRCRRRCSPRSTELARATGESGGPDKLAFGANCPSAFGLRGWSSPYFQRPSSRRRARSPGACVMSSNTSARRPSTSAANGEACCRRGRRSRRAGGRVTGFGGATRDLGTTGDHRGVRGVLAGDEHGRPTGVKPAPLGGRGRARRYFDDSTSCPKYVNGGAAHLLSRAGGQSPTATASCSSGIPK